MRIQLEGKKRRYQRIISGIAKGNKDQWKRGIQKISKKVERLRKKIGGSQEDAQEEWIKEMAQGSGAARKKIKVQVAVYGEIQPPIDQDELDAASLPAPYRLFPKVKIEKIKTNFTMGETKQRWSRADKLIDSKGDVIREEEGEQEKTDEEVVQQHAHEEVYDPDKKTIDFRKLRCHRVKSNPTVIMPKARPAKEEAIFLTRRHKAMSITAKYLEEQATMENLTPSERRGVKKLLRE